MLNDGTLIRKCTTDDLEKLIALAYEKNQIEEHNSAYCCLTFDSIKRDFTDLLSDPNNSILGYYKGNDLFGLLGLYVDMDGKNIDCIGPFALEHYDKIALELFQFAFDTYSTDFTYNFFFNKKNEECYKLMQTLHARDKGNEKILILEKDAFIDHNNSNNVIFLPESYKEEFSKLHNKIFPDIYISGQGILKTLGSKREVLCLIDNQCIIAYGVLELPDYGTCATAEIIAVDETYRGRGYGKVILNEVIKQVFLRNYTSISLVVDNINDVAQRLYYSFGFHIQVENCAFCVEHKN